MIDMVFILPIMRYPEKTLKPLTQPPLISQDIVNLFNNLAIIMDELFQAQGVLSRCLTHYTLEYKNY